MQLSKIPCYMHPMEVILIDDNLNFIRNLEMALGHQFKCHSYEDPREALDYISQNTKQHESFMSKYIFEGTNSTQTMAKNVTIDLPNIHKEIYNPDRFKEISVVIVDYGMPTMNGLELCRSIRALTKNPIKLIMLTGEADYTIAVTAFNEGLIDKFILKNQNNYTEEVANSIYALQEKYCYDSSESIRCSLQPVAQDLLDSKEFNDLFNKIIHENHAVEFYILEDSLSFLFLDVKGEKPVWLIIKTEEDMEMQYELARDDRGISPAIVEALQKRKKLAYFPNQSSMIASAQHWALQNATPLKEKKYYYAIVKGTKDYPLDKPKIFSYHAYLNSI